MLTLLALIAIVIFLFSGMTPLSPHVEWMSGIEGLFSFATLLIFATWFQKRAKRQDKLSLNASPLIARLQLPSRPFFSFLLPALSLISLIPPLLLVGGFWNDVRAVLSLHFFLIALFLDVFLFANRPGKDEITLGAEVDLGKYRENIDGATEAILKGISSNGISLADTGLALLPSNFSPQVKELEYRSLYLLENLEVIAHRAIDKTLFPLVQKILSRVLRLSGNLLPDSPPLATAGAESAGRIVQSLIAKGYLEAADKALFTFAQGVRSLKQLPIGLGDFLIRTVLELEKGLENLYKANKERPIKTLFVPLAELKRTLAEDRFAANPETILGQRELDRVIEVFKTLETVLRTSPTPPTG